MPRSAEQQGETTQPPTGARGPRKIVAPDVAASQADDSSKAEGTASDLYGLRIVILGLVLSLLWSGCLAWWAYRLLARFLAA